MKKGNVKSFLAGVVVCAVMTGGTVAFAAPVQRTIEAVFGQVKLVVDGKPVEQETLLYNGTTYVPLRAAAEALGKEVSYDGETKTAYIGQVPASADTKTEQAPASSQAELEAEYLKFMVDVYYGMQGSLDKVEAETALLDSDPSLIMDASWLKEFKAVIDEFSVQLDKLSAYDKTKVPAAYREFHEAFVSGSQSFKEGIDIMFYGIENLDEDAIMEAEEYIEEALIYFEKAADLTPDFGR